MPTAVERTVMCHEEEGGGGGLDSCVDGVGEEQQLKQEKLLVYQLMSSLELHQYISISILTCSHNNQHIQPHWRSTNYRCRE